MKPRFLYTVFLLLLLPALVCAASPRLAVGEFVVMSDNPRLKFVGKGLAEMVAAEIASSRDVILVDRSRRADLLGELEFSLGDAADPAALVRFGKLLTADLILFGEIIDMDTAVLVSCSLVKVETGEVVWADKNLGPLSDYNGISRKLAASALKGLGLSGAAVAAAPRKEPRATEAKKEEALIAFSDAVDAVDRKDEKLARRKIREVQAVDPGNAAVVYLASLLSPGSPRLLVELDKYAPTYNPALAAGVDTGVVYAWNSHSALVGADVGEHNIVELATENGGLLNFKEQGNSIRLGLLYPLGRRAGMSAEISGAFKNSYIGNSGGPVVVGDPSQDINTDQSIESANLGFGYALSSRWSLGISVYAEYLEKNIGEEVGSWYDFFPEAQGVHVGASVGATYRNPDGRFSADGMIVWSNQPDFYVLSPDGGINAVTPGEFVKGSVPVILSLGGSYGLSENRILPNLRIIAEIGTDERQYFAGRIQPGCEWRPFDRLNLRTAYEYVFVTSEQGAINGGGASADGHGVMAGASVSLGKFDVTLNAIYRYRPFRLMPGSGHQDFTWMMGVSWNGLGRRK